MDDVDSDNRFSSDFAFWQAGDGSWLDELHTSWVVTDGLKEISDRASMGNQNALYFFFPWLTTALLGESEFSLRLPSLLASLLLILTAYSLVSWATGSRLGGLTTACLLAVDPYCIFYAQEARVYAGLQLVGLLHIGLMCRLLHRPDGKTRAAFVLVAIVLFYLHYTTIFLLAAEAIGYLLLWCRRSWRPCYRWPSFGLDVSWVFLGCLPAAGHLWEIAQRRANWNLFISNDVKLSDLP